MISFVTLFDKGYLTRGLALYRSLVKHCSVKFNLYILGMDNCTVDYLKTLALPNVSVISVDDMKTQYPVLIKLEKERTRAEFSWTLSAFSIQYVLKKYNPESCTYLDSDIYFFNDPMILINECKGKSVLITEHKYTPIYDQTLSSGKFCVQFMYFKNDNDGNNVLEYWRMKNEEWCYARLEDGKNGDQMYLDDWESRFKGIVYNCLNVGCGIAPWNIQRYSVFYENEECFVMDNVSKVKERLVFYHFHALRQLSKNRWMLSDYQLRDDAKKYIYSEYITKLKDEYDRLPIEMKNERYYKIAKRNNIRLFIQYIKQFRVFKKRQNEFLNNIVEI